MSDAGWKPDPTGRHKLRYWNGSKWTEHVSDKTLTQSVDPMNLEDEAMYQTPGSEVPSPTTDLSSSPNAPLGSSLKRCPMCGENIQVAAVLCRFCGATATPNGWVNPTDARRGTNGFAIAAMVLGIVWIYWIGSVLALVFGYTARRQIQESRGLQGGSGMATAGIVLGWIGIAVLAALITFFLIVVAVGEDEELSLALLVSS